MKRVVTIILVVMIMMMSKITTTDSTTKAKGYKVNGIVTEVIDDDVIIVDERGNEWAMNQVDLTENDRVILVMSDNATRKEVTDDVIICVKR